MRVYLYSDVMEHAHHGTPPLQVSIYTMVQAPMALYSLVFDSNLTKTKCIAIEQGIKQ